MSRFFATGGSSDSSSSDDDEASNQQELQTISKFVFPEGDSEQTKRVVRTASVKQIEELNAVIHQIKNFMKIKDYGNLVMTLGALERFMNAKISQKTILRCFGTLELFINESWDDKVHCKKLSKTSFKALVALRNRIKKNHKSYDFVYDENESEDDSDDHSDNNTSFANRQSALIDSCSEDTDAESTTSDRGPTLRDYFLKSSTDKGQQKKRWQKVEENNAKKTMENSKIANDDDWTTVPGNVFSTDEKILFQGSDKVTSTVVCKKINELVVFKQKRSVRKTQIQMLESIPKIIEQNQLGQVVEFKFKYALARAYLSCEPSFASGLKSEYWIKLIATVNSLSQLLNGTVNVEINMDIEEVEEQVEVAPYLIRGSVVSLLEEVDDEFFKVLKDCEPFTNDYIERLKDEATLINILDNILCYVQSHGTTDEISRIYLRKIEHTYFKLDRGLFDEQDKISSFDAMNKMCHFIFENNAGNVLRTRAILAKIYYYAIHDKWFEARDLMLMSQLSQSIHHADVPTQIMYNRATAQLGMCAFRRGFFLDAHNCLEDLLGSGRARELLGQGLQSYRFQERTQEEEKRDRQWLLPYHMHIPNDLLECIYLISAMILEVPNMMQQEADPKRKIISKGLYHLMLQSQKHCLVGPPETMREHVVAAAKAMRSGNWQQVLTFIVNDKMNAKVWNFIHQPFSVSATLEQTFKMGCHRTYIKTYGESYSTLNLDLLASMFELDINQVQSLTTSMLIGGEITGSLDELSQNLNLQNQKRNSFLIAGKTLGERLGLLLDHSERLVERKYRGKY